MKHLKHYQLLAYSGTLPFFICLILKIFNIEEIPILGNTDQIFLSYGLLIVSFMAGIHWGVQLCCEDKATMNLFITSNIITLATWFCYLFTNQAWTLVAYILSFSALLFIDSKLFKSGVITRDYLQTRLKVSLFVIMTLLLYAFALMAA